MNVIKKYLEKRKDEKLSKKADEEFKALCDKADSLSKKTGKRYFVVPATKDTLTIVDSTYRKAYNRQKGVKKININDLIRMAYYATSSRSLTIRT